MRPREYCCCALPLINAGIYATLMEQFVAAIVVGTLSVAAPSIVGAATPSFAPALLAAFCYVAAAIQILGFLGVAREKPILYRRYTALNTGACVAVFAIAAVWLIMSASRHSTAQSVCEADYFPPNSSVSTASSDGQALCNIFAWLDIGLMAGAWVFFALVQAYFLFIVSSYGASQRNDHEKYEALYVNDSTEPLTDDIPMADRVEPWDSRASHVLDDGDDRGHVRADSTASTPDGHKEGFRGYLPVKGNRTRR